MTFYFQICLIDHFLWIFLLSPLVFGDYTFKYVPPDLAHVCQVWQFCINSEEMKSL